MSTFTPSSTTYEHVIIGGGIAADKAARAIKEVNPQASVLMISADVDAPIYRPALTKDLWIKQDSTLEGQALGTVDTGAELLTGVSVTAIDPEAHTVTTGEGQAITYGSLLLATGCSARHFQEAPADPRIVYFREAADYRQLRDQLGDDFASKNVAIVGGGYIGSELAAGLNIAGADVTVYFDGKKLLEHMLPADITDHVDSVYRDKGVKLVPGFLLQSVEVTDTQVRLIAPDGSSGEADVVVLGLGATANTGLAESLGIELVEGGIPVDAYLCTGLADIYAAGDIITFEDPLLGTRRVEHVDMAEKSGTVAGKNMAGESTEFSYTPFFFSDLFDDGYEAVGELHASYRTHTVWDEAHRAAVAYYIQDDAIRGVLLWNTWGQLSRAREIISESRNRIFKEDEIDQLITPGG